MEKLGYLSPEEAVAVIKDGDRVVIGHACGEPTVLTKALAQVIPKLNNVETLSMIGMSDSMYCNEAAAGHTRHHSLFVGPNERRAISEGRADYTPVYFSKIPELLEDTLPPDVALIQVSPPDKHGYVSLGISVDYTLSVAKNAKTTIAQVNENMPRSMGDSFLHLSDIDILVEGNTDVIEMKRSQLTDVELAIGRNCASLIEDGATLQLGIGSLPDAVLASLNGKKDLGIHTEMFSDGVMELFQQGIINNRRKTLHKDKIVASFAMGSKALYQFIDDNPAIHMVPVDYVNDPNIIAQNEQLVSINSCVQVDLQGQVCAESVGLTQISAVGGQVDFIRGARMSKGGRSIIAITSTARGGKVSKIVPFLDQGAAVTTGRNDVEYIVTEYGIANLRGKTMKDRAFSLIEIAHPDFRTGLITEWEKRFNDHYSLYKKETMTTIAV